MASRVRVFVVVVAAVVAASLLPTIVECRVRRYKFNVVMKNVTRLCTTKPIVTVNGMFPGPTIYAREDDNLLVEVVNNVHYNVTIHWHGIRQIRTGFADGPAYVTQCPIQPGQSYVYNFTVTGQRGTLLWHAHILWLRATVHGAMVILPKLHVPYPFPVPHKEVIIILGEWWNSDVEAVIDEALASGLSPNVSDAHTINGYPGPMSECASQDGGGYKLKVKSGNKYLLRIVNAALNEELFFRVSGHRFTVVETDGIYTKPFVTDTILVGPGQTTNAILSADASPGRYAITASTFLDTPIPVDKAPAIAVIRYTPTPTTTTAATLDPPPAVNATPVAFAFIDSLRSLNSADYPARVPMEVDHSLLFAVGVGVNPCETCPGGSRVVADINNVTFLMPKVCSHIFYNF
ncbi:Laccase-22 [Acorus calamus]|uniref:laccase n=1 Tax=Acorus calamus TaxID=4465 RepID=A0AAV9DCY6_ACOCL|nr:Laccase-22 [Acorus calamus]